MIVLGLPVVNQHELTKECLEYLEKSIKLTSDFRIVVIDNGSQVPYTKKELQLSTGIALDLIRNEENVGFYYPLKQLHEKYPDAEIIGMMHNDLFLYEHGWDERMLNEFRKDSALGLVGLCGSDEVDSAGGRGGGTMCYFRGEKGQPQSAGKQIYNLEPALVLDSLFMMFRTSSIPLLLIDENIVPCHFYDKIWSMRIVENNQRVGVLGVECDHMGGMTAIADTQYQKDAAKWCDKMRIPYDKNDPGLTVYVEAEKRFLTEYREEKRKIPARIDKQWIVRYG